jgi:hypothetical protein
MSSLEKRTLVRLRSNIVVFAINGPPLRVRRQIGGRTLRSSRQLDAQTHLAPSEGLVEEVEDGLVR